MEDVTREILAFLLEAVRWDAQARAWNTPWEWGDAPEELKILRQRVDTAKELLANLGSEPCSCQAEADREAEELATLRRLVGKHPKEAIGLVSNEQIGAECVRRSLIRMNR